MKLRSILTVFVVMTYGSLFAQNVTKANLDKLANQINVLSQKISQLETNLERVITENVNLVEQLNIKTVTSVTDKNGIQWDIVKVEPDEGNSAVILTLRITNNSGVMQSFGTGFNIGQAIDSNSNLANNCYNVKVLSHNLDLQNMQSGVPLNFLVKIENIPTTCSYLATINMRYSGYNSTKDATFRFTGVHIPW